jgi:hypothetical protein
MTTSFIGEALAGGWRLAAAYLVLGFTLPLEAWLLRPNIGLQGRPAVAHGLHFGLLGLLFTLLAALLQRPLFAAGLAIAFVLLVIFVNNAKYQALREPFVFSDFGLFSQVFRFPRLYLPFLGPGGAVGLPLLVGLVLYAGLVLEPSLAGWPGFAPALAAGAAVSLGLLHRAGRAGLRPSLDPAADLARFGLVPSLWLYWRAEAADPGPIDASPFRAPTGPALRGRADLPHIVVVQSESFFDVRRLPAAIRPEVLARFDAVRAAAVRAGRLAVPAWGANTMRAEFAFLSGIDSEKLGVHRFNPYRRFARRPLPGLPRYLRSLGYRTVCVHPHEKGFFGRDRVFEALGFTDFIDIEAFRGAARAGPYIGDGAVTAKLLELLKTADRPLFLFAITMENHGPLHLERVQPGDVESLYAAPPPPGCDDLTVYLRHLRNADRMIGELRHALAAGAGEGLLCFFGDHVPSMPKVYAALQFDDGRTDYLLWRTSGGSRVEADIDASELGMLLLEEAGLGAFTSPDGVLAAGRADPATAPAARPGGAGL